MGLAAALAFPGVGSGIAHASAPAPGVLAPTTPIKHVVVIFQENVSFDHYFGTYPQAANTSG
jgi:phospholipase C